MPSFDPFDPCLYTKALLKEDISWVPGASNDPDVPGIPVGDHPDASSSSNLSKEQTAGILRQIIALFKSLQSGGMVLDTNSLRPALYEIADSVGESSDYDEATDEYDPNSLAEILGREVDTLDAK